MKECLRAHTTDWDVQFLDLPETCITLVKSYSNSHYCLAKWRWYCCLSNLPLKHNTAVNMHPPTITGAAVVQASF